MSNLSPAAQNHPGMAGMGTLLERMFSGPVVAAAIRLGLAEQLGENPVSVAELAQRTGTEPEALARLMHALTAMGIFTYTDSDHIAHTPASAMLAIQTPAGNLIDAFANSVCNQRLWQHLPQAMRTGHSPFPQLYGTDFFAYITHQDPQLAALFNAAMTHGIGQTNPAVVAALDVAECRVLVDVGGGQGSLLRDVLRAYPHLQGVLFDIPTAVDQADTELSCGPLSGRSEIVAGDARASVPQADAYVFRTILHNWDDDSCVAMLSACARNATPGTRIFVIDIVADLDHEDPLLPAMMDLHMLLMFGSKERTRPELAQLFDRAGLAYVTTTPIPDSPFHLTEARLPR